MTNLCHQEYEVSVNNTQQTAVHQQTLTHCQQSQAARLPQKKSVSQSILWIIAAAVPVASKPVAAAAAEAPAVAAIVAAALAAACSNSEQVRHPRVVK